MSLLYCPGQGCPLRADCYRHTQPSPGRDRFAALPYDPASQGCAYFHSNLPTDEQVRAAAYYLWLREGRPDGRADIHWREAYTALCRSTGRLGHDPEGAA
jgi:hypothetical protein